MCSQKTRPIPKLNCFFNVGLHAVFIREQMTAKCAPSVLHREKSRDNFLRMTKHSRYRIWTEFHVGINHQQVSAIGLQKIGDNAVLCPIYVAVSTKALLLPWNPCLFKHTNRFKKAVTI